LIRINSELRWPASLNLIFHLAMTAIEFPPMQKGASFNLGSVKAKIEAARTAMAK